MEAIITVMRNAAEQAARAILRDFGEIEQLQVSRKGPTDFVTRADRKAEKIIIAELSRARPDYAILAEESGYDDNKNPIIFIIDPIDGTKNFIHGLPHTCISIALAENQELQAGLIYDITRHECFWATFGGGAYLDGKRMRVSGKNSPHEMLISTGLPTIKRNDEGGGQERTKAAETWGRIGQEFGSMRCFGSAALDLAYVAAGRADGFWHNSLKPWDVAAGVLMVREAGGMVQNFEGKNYKLGCENIIAAQPETIDPLRRLI